MRRGAVFLLLLAAAATGLSHGGGDVAIKNRSGTLVLTNVEPGKKPTGVRRGGSPAAKAGGAVAGSQAPAQRPYAALIKRIAQRHGIDHNLVHAIIAVESGYDPRAVSRTGAVGLMQLLPSTAAELGIHDLTDAHDNIVGGVRHLRRLLDRFSGNLTLALAAYNAGAAAVDRYQGVPPFPETQAYVRRVRRFYDGSGRSTRPDTIYRYTDPTGVRVYSQFAPPESAAGGGAQRR